ncbi:hypothetical protein [Bartonella mastomydis]|nr:hypothetical protein [Bartonella mastomydis]
MQTKSSHFNDISYQAKEFVIEEFQCGLELGRHLDASFQQMQKYEKAF